MSVEPDRRGGWVTRWRDPNGRQRSRKFRLKRDAVALDLEIKRRSQLGPLALQQLTARGGPTLDQWIEQRWAPEHAATLEQATRERYASSYKLHVQPGLGDLPLAHLDVAKLRDWQAWLVAGGTSADAVRKARVVLSSILRHAAESGAIPANPLSVVRPPRSEQRDAVRPLSPAMVERLRAVLAAPMPIPIPEGQRSGKRRAPYDMPDQRSAQTRARDALIVSVLAYGGLRPEELRALRWRDVGENTILVQRAADLDGSIKPVKNAQPRSVRLLVPLAQDLREYKLIAGRPPEESLITPRTDGNAWTREDWGNWRGRTWRTACARAGLEMPRPYDLRHSAASLWLAERRQALQVARWLGHSVAVLHRTYAHLIDEYEDRERVDAEAEIAAARAQACASEVRQIGELA